nr:hypothetical protein [Tanacetum cinerariifolium]
SSNTPMDKENPWGKDGTRKEVENAMRCLIKGILNIYTSFGEHNVDFHPMVDFIEASPLRYALTVKPTVYVSHIRQFWSTARIETTKEGTKILTNVDGIVKTISESSLSMQQTIPELMALCTSLQRQLFELTDKFQAQEVEINRLKARVKLLEEREGLASKSSGDDAPNQREEYR